MCADSAVDHMEERLRGALSFGAGAVGVHLFPYVLAQPRKAPGGKRKIHAVVGAEAERPARSEGPPRRQGTQVCEVLLRRLLPCAAQRRNGRIDLSEVRKKTDRENLKMSPFEKSAEGRFFCTL